MQRVGTGIPCCNRSPWHSSPAHKSQKCRTRRDALSKPSTEFFVDGYDDPTHSLRTAQRCILEYARFGRRCSRHDRAAGTCGLQGAASDTLPQPQHTSPPVTGAYNARCPAYGPFGPTRLSAIARFSVRYRCWFEASRRREATPRSFKLWSARITREVAALYYESRELRVHSRTQTLNLKILAPVCYTKLTTS